MKTPRPANTAAVITMLRMTPHCLRKPFPISPLRPRDRDPAAPGKAAIFAKSMTEALTASLLLSPSFAGRASKRESGPARLDPAGRQRVGGILRPGMARIAPAQIGADRC